MFGILQDIFDESSDSSARDGNTEADQHGDGPEGYQTERGGGEPRSGELQTPVSREAITEARSTITDDVLAENDRSLVELLNTVQQYIDNQEYVDRPGNAFVERLVEDINDRNSLRRLLVVGDQEILVIIGADGWAQMTDELGLNDREAIAVRDAHHMYAETRGLAEYVTQVNILAIRMYDERLRAFLEEIEPAHADMSEARIAELLDQLTPAAA